MKNILFVLLIFCFAGLSFAQQRNSYSLNGIFKTPDSAVIGGLRVDFNNSGQKDYTYTDINGEFKIALPPGSYEVTIDKSISETFIAFIDIQESGLNPSNIEFLVEPRLNFCGVSCPKLISFADPVYPQAARAVRATGQVIVRVKIDREGKVIAAIAESGHPLLRGASEQAARKSVFEPSENAGEREAKLTFVFLQSDNEKKNIKRYSDPYRKEIVDRSLHTIDY